jgi:hypothetical protein
MDQDTHYNNDGYNRLQTLHNLLYNEYGFHSEFGLVETLHLNIDEHAHPLTKCNQLIHEYDAVQNRLQNHLYLPLVSCTLPH